MRHILENRTYQARYVYVRYVCAKWRIRSPCDDDTRTTESSTATREKAHTGAERIASSLARIVSRVLRDLFLLHVRTYLDYKECRRTVRYFCGISLFLSTIGDVPRRRRGFSLRCLSTLTTLYMRVSRAFYPSLIGSVSLGDARRRLTLLLERPCAILRRLLSPIEPISRYSILSGRNVSHIFGRSFLPTTISLVG